MRQNSPNISNIHKQALHSEFSVLDMLLVSKNSQVHGANSSFQKHKLWANVSITHSFAFVWLYIYKPQRM